MYRIRSLLNITVLTTIFIWNTAVFSEQSSESSIITKVPKTGETEPEKATTTSTEPVLAKFVYAPDRTLAIHYLLQAQAFSPEFADNQYGTDFMIRRNRILFMGTLTKNVSFFTETDDFKIGDNGNYYQENFTFIQDAYINYKFSNAFEVAAGLILLPFSHHNRAGAISLLGLDYNAEVIKLRSNNVWRDTGLEARGLLFKTLNGDEGFIDYRAGVFQGTDRDETDSPNHGDSPRFTGRVQLNFLDSEKKFYYNDNPLKNVHQLSLGGGIDYQHNASWNENLERDDSLSYSADLIFNQPVASDMITLESGWYNYDNETYSTVDASSNGGYTGMTTYAQLGYFIHAINIQPVIRYSLAQPEDSNLDSSSFATGGLNYFIDGHHANIKGEFRYGVEETDPNQITLQAQIFL